MSENQQEVFERHWDVYRFEDKSPGHEGEENVVLDAEITADPDLLRIMIDAQRNPTVCGYWRDMAAGLADLVDKLRKEQATICSLLYALGIPSSNEDGWGENVMRLKSFMEHRKRRLTERQEKARRISLAPRYQQCTAITKAGKPCLNAATRGTDPPRCGPHGGTRRRG